MGDLLEGTPKIRRGAYLLESGFIASEAQTRIMFQGNFRTALGILQISRTMMHRCTGKLGNMALIELTNP